MVVVVVIVMLQYFIVSNVLQFEVHTSDGDVVSGGGDGGGGGVDSDGGACDTNLRYVGVCGYGRGGGGCGTYTLGGIMCM